MNTPQRLHLVALPGIPLVEPGDSLAELVIQGCERAGEELTEGDALVVAQKIVSKAEGRLVDLATVEPSTKALALAAEADKDPRLIELILRESRQVLRVRPGVIVVEHRLGLVLANAGIDHSNVEQPQGTLAGTDERVLLLPEDPDRSATLLRDDLLRHCGKRIGVIIADSLGRAWRVGTVGTAIGCAGLESVQDLRGEPDLFGTRLRVTDVGFADQVAAAASILLGQAGEGRPVVLVRGLAPPRTELDAKSLVRPKNLDLFR